MSHSKDNVYTHLKIESPDSNPVRVENLYLQFINVHDYTYDNCVSLTRDDCEQILQRYQNGALFDNTDAEFPTASLDTTDSVGVYSKDGCDYITLQHYSQTIHLTETGLQQLLIFHKLTYSHTY